MWVCSEITLLRIISYQYLDQITWRYAAAQNISVISVKRHTNYGRCHEKVTNYVGTCFLNDCVLNEVDFYSDKLFT